MRRRMRWRQRRNSSVAGLFEAGTSVLGKKAAPFHGLAAAATLGEDDRDLASRESVEL